MYFLIRMNISRHHNAILKFPPPPTSTREISNQLNLFLAGFFYSQSVARLIDPMINFIMVKT
jgi:hypothetical protein